MAQSRTKDMTQGSILPLIVKFSLPLLMGNFFQQTYNLVDTAIVGQTLGAKALAAVGSSTSIQFLVMGFCIGMSLGFPSLWDSALAPRITAACTAMNMQVESLPPYLLAL